MCSPIYNNIDIYYIANTPTSINQSCNNIKIYTELVQQDCLIQRIISDISLL